jgi:hypothetical protein
MRKTRFSFLILILGAGLTAAQECNDCAHRCLGGIYPAGAARSAQDEGERWGDGANTVVTWSFVDIAHTNPEQEPGVLVEPIKDGVGNFPANARALIREAFDDWQRVADITFVELADGSEGQMRVGAHSFSGTTLGHGFFPSSEIFAVGGDVHLNVDREWTGQELRSTATHEIGHGIGLKHIIDQGQVDSVIMFSLNQNDDRPTIKDIAYLQSKYGLPIPVLSGLSIVFDDNLNQELRVTWSYPTEPGAPTVFTRLHDGAISDGGEVTVTITENDVHDLDAFEVQSTPLVKQTFADGAEDNEDRVFDDDTPPLDDELSWERTGFRVANGAKAYRIDPELAKYSGDFSLPQLGSVLATETTMLRFRRAFFFTDVQFVRYYVSVDGGAPVLLDEENGSADFTQADSPFTEREFDLSAHAGREIAVLFEYHSASNWVTDDNGVSIDDIELIDVMSATGAPISHSTTIAPAIRVFDIAGLDVGIHNIELRANYDDGTDGTFISQRQTLAEVPIVVGVSSPTPAGTYGSGSEIIVDIEFNKIIQTVTGTPILVLDTRSNAEYVSGEGSKILMFRYIVQSGDLSERLQYDDATSLQLNGGTIQDANGIAVDRRLPAMDSGQSLGETSNLVIDAAGPIVEQVRAVIDGLYGIGETVEVEVEMNEPVTITGSPRLLLETGPVDGVATFDSVSDRTLLFTYIVQAGDVTEDLQCSDVSALDPDGGILEDALENVANVALPLPGAAGSLRFNSDVELDGVLPTVNNVTANTPNDTYPAGQVLELVVHFDESVIVTGTPILSLQFDGGIRSAEFAGGSATSDLVFRYTTQAGDNIDQLRYTGIGALTGGSIEDFAGNPANRTLVDPGEAGSLSANSAIRIDTIQPVVESVTSADAGVHSTNAVVRIGVTFDEPVTVSDVPELAFDLCDGPNPATYVDGSGTDTLLFDFTVVEGCDTEALDYASVSLTGTIVDDAGNAADLTLAAPGVLAGIGIIIDTTPPTIDGGFISGDNTFFDLRFSEGVFSGNGGEVLPGDLNLVLTGRRTTSAVTVSGIQSESGGALIGGESRVRVLLELTGLPDGSESLTVSSVSVVDRAGQPATGEVTGQFQKSSLWSITLTGDFDPESVVFGRESEATDGIDAMDIIASNDAALLFRAGDEQPLSKDLRSLQPLSRWRLEIAPGLENPALTWAVDDQPNFLMYLQPLDGESPAAPPVDMQAQAQFDPGAFTSFEIVYGPAEFATIQLAAGWNLVSIPLITVLPIAQALPAGLRTGSVWGWDGKRFAVVDETAPLLSERGFWVFSGQGGASQEMPGIVTDGVVSVGSPWTLIGVVEDGTAANGNVVWGWSVATQSFGLVEVLDQQQGYWWYSSVPTTIQNDP